ncbi:MAG: ATP-binding protein [Actinobacteria bacterium]|nr:MAG: ATP-binding protein [Actinomycetota bacterium]
MEKEKKSITIKSDPKNISKARRFVEIIAKQYGFTDSQIFDIKVASGEAISNAIEHGSPLGAKSNITVEADFSKNCLELKVIDRGIFKKQVKVDNPDPRHRGRGIPFMLALMDTVTIKEGKKGTTVKLIKKLK